MGRCLERAGLGPQGLLLRTLCGVLGKAANVEKSQVPHVWQWSPVILYVFLAGVTLRMALTSATLGASRHRGLGRDPQPCFPTPACPSCTSSPEGLSRSTPVGVGSSHSKKKLSSLCYVLSLCRELCGRPQTRESRSG